MASLGSPEEHMKSLKTTCTRNLVLLKRTAKHSICLTYGQRTKGTDVEAVVRVIASGAQVGAEVLFQLSQHRSGRTTIPTIADVFYGVSCLGPESEN